MTTKAVKSLKSLHYEYYSILLSTEPCTMRSFVFPCFYSFLTRTSIFSHLNINVKSVRVCQLCPLVLRTAMTSLHYCLSLVSLSMDTRVWPNCFRPSGVHHSTTFVMVSLPLGVHRITTFVMVSLFILRTWPIHHLLLVIRVFMLSMLHWWSRPLLVIFAFQKIRWIFLRHVVWKDESLAVSRLFMHQHSDPYIRVDRTRLP